MPVQAEEAYSIKIMGNLSPGAFLYLSIYDKSAKNWKSIPIKKMQIKLPEKEIFTYPLPLLQGRYAIRAFVDINNDQALALSDKGKPLEPYGSSIGDGRRRASFRYALSKFKLGERHHQARITLRYPPSMVQLGSSRPTPSVPEPHHEKH